MICNAAIICPGPSHSLYPGADNYDVIVGVNGAASVYVCDWWCFCDYDQYANQVAQGCPALFIKDSVRDEMMKHRPDLVGAFDTELTVPHSAVQWSDHAWIMNGVQMTCRWNSFSGLAALGLMEYLGVRRADVYGADMAGTTDMHGVEKANDRRPERWEIERELWQVLVGRLLKEDITVQRIMANGRVG